MPVGRRLVEALVRRIQQRLTSILNLQNRQRRLELIMAVLHTPWVLPAVARFTATKIRSVEGGTLSVCVLEPPVDDRDDLTTESG